MSLPRLAATRPISTLMVFGIMALIGVSSLFSLPVELLPELSFPRITVSTDYPGAGPEEVENLVTRVLEETVSTAVGVQDVISTSSEGASRVTVTFPFSTDLNAATADVRAAIERARRRLPEGASTPIVFKFDPSQFPIVQIGLVAQHADLDLAALQQLADERVLFRLERIPGVAQVSTSGGVKRQVHVALDPIRMQALALSERDVLNALASANLAAPGGQVTEGTRRLGLRVLSQYGNVDQIRRTVVSVRSGTAITVGDVARVEEGESERTTFVRINGRPGVLISVLRQSGANTVAVADRILQEARRLNTEVSGVTLIVLNDSARFVRSSIRSVQQALLVGGTLAIAVLLLFLRDVRSVLIIATAVPVSVLAAFVLMFLFGYTLNLMTLGALALGVGMLVDASIVVIENIFRHRQMGRRGVDGAATATDEVASAIVASTLTTVVVFLPVIFMRGSVITTQLFYQFSIVVAVALLCSLAVAMTLIPSLAARLPTLLTGTERGWTGRLQASYRRTLTWALRHRGPVFAVSAAVFLMGTSSFVLLGRETIPQADEGEIFVSVQLPVGTRLELTSEALTGLERVVREAVPEVRDITISAGSTFGAVGSHRGTLRIRLAERSRRQRTTGEIATQLRRRLQVPGGRVSVRASAGALAVLRFGGGADPVEVEIRGFDLRRGMEIAQQVRGLLEEIPGITDASVAREEQLPEIIIRVDSARAAAFGLTPAQISSAVRTSLAGGVATILRAEGREADIVVRLQQADRLSTSDLLGVPLITQGGRRILLGQVAQLVPGEGPAQILRRQRQRAITVTAGISGRDFGSVMDEVRTRVARIPVPEGFSLTLGQEFEEQQRAYRQLTLGFVLAVVLVYAVMAIQFEALLEPLIIIGSIPFALAGALLTLFLTKTTLNIQSLIGLIVLTGVIVNNAIVLIQFILTLRRRDGLPLEAAAIEGSVTRLRPVLMTTMTTVAGLLPVAVGLGEGAELQAPLARAVVGGLTLGTLVTLVFIPTLYVAVETLRERRRATQAVRAPAPQPAPLAGAENGEDRL